MPARTRPLLLVLAIFAAPALGCSSSNTAGADESQLVERRRPNVASAPPIETTPLGLWALDGEPANGDVSLLALDSAMFAGVVHSTFIPSASKEGLELAGQPVQADFAAIGSLLHEGPDAASLANGGEGESAPPPSASPSTFAVGEDDSAQRYTFALEPHRLRVTRDDGAVFYYTRSYKLYCTLADPGRESTMILELGAEPKVIGVNGDGIRFPAAGNYAAAVRTEELFEGSVYTVESDIRTGRIVVRLPWATMAQPRFSGAVTIVPSGQAEANLRPTSVACERIVGF